MKNIGNQDERTTVMGMSASQARFLSLTARKTNVEYEGQQINQQRTTLSNESSNYYSQLCSLTVPTPPSTEDYSKTTYTFTDGQETNTINSLIAQTGGKYILNYTQSTLTDTVVSNGNVIVTRKANGNDYDYYIGATKLRTLTTKDTSDAYLSTLDSTELTNTMNLEEEYLTMLKKKYKRSDWYVRYQLNSTTQTYEPVFYNSDQIKDADYNKDTDASISSIKSYVYGQETESREIKNATARVEQDTSGRYMSITIYEMTTDASGNQVIKTDDNGNEVGTTYSLTATTTADDDAYNDAMNQYNYNKA